jgi:murein DD-endopeptidase MepM/ murein hydrolase activator NlpD
MGYINILVIDHGYGIRTLYGQISRILVKDGEKVKRGDIIERHGEYGTFNGAACPYLRLW